MTEGLREPGSMQKYEEQMRWEQGRAREFCRGGEGCSGPSVGNLSFGPDGGGSMIISACNRACANCIRDGMPAGAWITHPESWEETVEIKRRKLAK